MALENEQAEKKALFEKSFADREANLKNREDELQSMRAKVEEFPAVLEKSLIDAQQQLTEKLNAKYQYEASLRSKETEGDTKLLKQMIGTLETKIKEKDMLIDQLTQKSNQATLQIQDIAVKAIEGASASRNFQSLFARQNEAEKSVKA